MFSPFLLLNSAAILLKKQRKPARKPVSNVLRKKSKQFLKLFEPILNFYHLLFCKILIINIVFLPEIKLFILSEIFL